MKKFLLHILFIISVSIIVFSCEDNDYISSPDVQLNFSCDTVMFDTIFTTIGSTTHHLKVINPYSDKIQISKINLAGGEYSNFRLNINGIEANEAYEVEIQPYDSIYIFIEVTIDPNGNNLPMVVQDSIIFTTNASIQNVDLIAWGQDFNLVRGEVLETTEWTNEKPYLVYDYAIVDSLETLTINPGTRIYFHEDARLVVAGTILANGTFENPIIFQGDRLEDDYENLPEQWQGILLYSGSHNNVFDFVTVKNANIGLQVGTLEQEGYSSVNISNSRIENMSYAGIFAISSDIYGYNNLIANCGFYAAALVVGGNYEFYHTTIANYWGLYSNKPRQTSSLTISNKLYYKDTEYIGDLEKAVFGNSIIYGNNFSELELGKTDEKAFNYFFDHCIIQVPDTFDISNSNHFNSVWTGSEYDPLFIDPYEDYIYELDSLSPALDIGSTIYSTVFPYDLKNELRNIDDGPDLGAFERIEKEEED